MQGNGKTKASSEKRAPAVCSKACVRGNPHRGYLCSCRKCGGGAHGASKITLAVAKELFDVKLRDPYIGKAEWNRWHDLMMTILKEGRRPRLVRRNGRRQAA